MKKIILFSVLFPLLFCFGGFSQNMHVIDSLKNIIADINKNPAPCVADTHRINACFELGDLLIRSDIDSTLRVEILAKELAENLINILSDEDSNVRTVVVPTQINFPFRLLMNSTCHVRGLTISILLIFFLSLYVIPNYLN